MLLTGVTIGPDETSDDSTPGTWLVDVAADLAHRLDVELEAVHVALGQVAAAGVERQPRRRARSGSRSVQNSLTSSGAQKPCSIRLITTPPVKFS